MTESPSRKKFKEDEQPKQQDDQPSTSHAQTTNQPVKIIKELVATVSANSKKQKLDPRPSSSGSEMDSSEEYDDSGNESSGEDVEFVNENDGKSNDHTSDDDYPFIVLSTEAIVQHMIDSIRDANTVLQLPPTTMRILLNHFGWDKEKLLGMSMNTKRQKLSPSNCSSNDSEYDNESDCGVSYSGGYEPSYDELMEAYLDLFDENEKLSKELAEMKAQLSARKTQPKYKRLKKTPGGGKQTKHKLTDLKFDSNNNDYKKMKGKVDKDESGLYPCPFENCSTNFKYKSHCFLHLRDVHSGKQYPCSTCGKILGSAHSRSLHTKRFHTARGHKFTGALPNLKKVLYAGFDAKKGIVITTQDFMDEHRDNLVTHWVCEYKSNPETGEPSPHKFTSGFHTLGDLITDSTRSAVQGRIRQSKNNEPSKEKDKGGCENLKKMMALNFHLDIDTVKHSGIYSIGPFTAERVKPCVRYEVYSTYSRNQLDDMDKFDDEAYYDSDQEQLFREARVINPNTSRSQNSVPTSGVEDCEICYLQKPSTSMYGMECGHRFCCQCWSEYLTTKIMEEGMGQTIACAAHNCPILVDDATVMKLLTDPKVKLKYQHLITNSFVQCNRLMRWCPSADCTNAIRVQYNDWKPVTCTCGFKFCFQCGHAWHDPVKCCWLRKWLKKCDDDSETSNWIAANTKECPKCNATIEKDGGCNHMVCKNQNCKADFCWVCLGPWEPHGSSWYNCNRYDESEAKAARDAQEKSRSALQRYLFYCNRYMNHMQSLKFEHKLYASVKDKMEEMQQHNMSWIEVQFLKKAVDILCQCRQTLMYTYVFAFYLVKTNQSVLFEDNQRDLESATEKLSEYLERDITSENLADIKQKVQDKYRYCESRRQVLLEHVYEGYDKDWWVYIADC